MKTIVLALILGFSTLTLTPAFAQSSGQEVNTSSDKDGENSRNNAISGAGVVALGSKCDGACPAATSSAPLVARPDYSSLLPADSGSTTPGSNYDGAN